MWPISETDAAQRQASGWKGRKEPAGKEGKSSWGKGGADRMGHTFRRSPLLLSGPFHWTMTFPRSSRKTSPRLKLSQLISTCREETDIGQKEFLGARRRGLRPRTDRGRTDLGGPDVSLPFHMQQPLHVVGVGLFTENLLFARSWGESGGPHRGSLCPHG